ncbi:MAG: glycine zipper family protein [Actinomycetota bacterium]|nr:glycine zipper family protein [Actinomycetota bacterium]
MNVMPHTSATIDGVRRSVASFDDYGGAQRAVDTLSDRGFPVERVAIVGTGLRYVEQVKGRLTIGRSALSGAGRGALLGMLFWLLFGLFFTVEQGFLGVLVYSVAIGLIFGAIIGALDHAATGGRRDFSSVAHTQAERYDVQVDVEVADSASRLLREIPQQPAADHAPPSAA